MGHNIFNGDLPPGCRLSDIPGNRPEDELWEMLYDKFFDKDRLMDTTRPGTIITEDDYKLMNKLYNSVKLSDVIDKYITQAIEFGMDFGSKNAIDEMKLSRHFECDAVISLMRELNLSQETIIKIEQIKEAMELYKKLSTLEAQAYGKTIKIIELFEHLDDRDLETIFDDVFETLLQERKIE